MQCRRPGFDPWVRKILWRREWQPTLVFLPEKSHGQRSLVGYSLWGCKESDMTEQLSATEMLRKGWERKEQSLSWVIYPLDIASWLDPVLTLPLSVPPWVTSHLLTGHMAHVQLHTFQKHSVTRCYNCTLQPGPLLQHPTYLFLSPTAAAADYLTCPKSSPWPEAGSGLEKCTKPSGTRFL